MPTLVPQPATAESLAPFGALVGAAPGVPKLFEFAGTEVFGVAPFALHGTPELLLCSIAPRPPRVGLMERHFRHTQTYLSTDGKPFVMVLGAPTEGDMPPLDDLQAFLFTGGSGIALGEGVWHEFPFALEDDTRVAVVLVSEAHVNENANPAVPDDADGPDLQRRSLENRDLPAIEVDLRAGA